MITKSTIRHFCISSPIKYPSTIIPIEVVFIVYYMLLHTSASSASTLLLSMHPTKSSESELIRQRVQSSKPILIFIHNTYGTSFSKHREGKHIHNNCKNILENSGSMYKQLLLIQLRSRLGYSVILYYRAYRNERNHSPPLMYPNKEEHFFWLRTNGSQSQVLLNAEEIANI